MSDLRNAEDAIATAIHFVERVQATAPWYSVQHVSFVRSELEAVLIRLAKLRKTLGDVEVDRQPIGDLDPEPPAAA